MSYQLTLNMLSLLEGFNRQIRKVTLSNEVVAKQRLSVRKTKGGFNSDDSLRKLVYLAYKDIAKKWACQAKRSRSDDSL